MTDEIEDLFRFIGPEATERFEAIAGPDYRGYSEGENVVIRPALERRGFGKVRFSDGERDSFGPLSRIVTAVDQRGRTRRWCYG